ncbi:regulator of sirC expression with transglutaminase-like and TPR domain [Paraburkholderia atlantica]
MITMSRVLDYFSTLVAEDESLPLTETALSLAQDAYPDLDLQSVLAEIDELVLRLRRRMPDDADIRQKVGVLNRFFFRELGFASNLNDYYDPDNSHLNVVLKRRRGIPISLAVLYLEMAEQFGVPVRGVSFPGHFLLRVTTPDGDVMLDPTTGHSLSEAQMVEMLEPYVASAGDSVGPRAAHAATAGHASRDRRADAAQPEGDLSANRALATSARGATAARHSAAGQYRGSA